MIEAFGKIHQLGHRDVRSIFEGPVMVEEKVDGSQFSFAKLGGQLHCRSKGIAIDPEAPGMFAAAVQTARAVEHLIGEGPIYRCEFLAKNRHNVLTYNRTPDRNLVLWDVELNNRLLPCEQREVEAARLGLSPVPVFFHGYSDARAVAGFLDRESFLGGVRVEGIVIKRDRMVAKLVSSEFREMHTGKPAKPRTEGEDFRIWLADSVCNENRYAKVRQHLLERGELKGDNTDIGKLLKELHLDIEAECRDVLAEKLLEWAMPTVKKRASAGMAPWYQNRLQYESLLPKDE